MSIEWETIPIERFLECKNQLKYDEMIFNNNMNTRLSMSSLEVNSPRIDGHYLAKGMHEICDFINSGIEFPNENITMDEIREIIGYFVDLQVSRLDGFNSFQNILISVYVHREYEIKNDFFKNVIHSFLSAFCSVENYINNHLKNSQSFWTKNEEVKNLVHQYDKKLIKEFFQNYKENNSNVNDIINFCLFEIEFSDYIDSNFNLLPPKIPEFPLATSTIGIIHSIHFRDLPYHSPPAKQQIPDHKIAIEQFISLLNFLPEIINFPKTESFSILLDNAYKWGQNHPNLLIFGRMLLYGFIYQPNPKTTFFNELTLINYLKRDFKNHHIKPEILDLDLEQTTSFLNSFELFLENTLRGFLMPIQFLQGIFTKIILHIWGYIQKILASLEISLKSKLNLPKINIPEFDQLLNKSTLIWSTKIAYQFSNYYFELSYQCKVFLPHDLIFTSIIQKNIIESYLTILEKEKNLNSAYNLFEKKKEKGKKRIGILKSQDIKRNSLEDTILEIESKILLNYYYSCYYLMILGYKNNSIEKHPGQFYNL